MSEDKYTPNNQSIVIFNPDSDHEYALQFDKGERQIWATQKQIADMFGLDLSGVNRHIGNFKKQRGEGANEGIAKFAIPTAGGTQVVEHYNHIVIAFVGYNAHATERTIAFQKWVEGLILAALNKMQQATPLQLARQTLEALERQQEQLDNHAERISLLESHIQTDNEYFTVVGYFRYKGLQPPTLNEAQSIGQRASHLSRVKSFGIGKTTDPRYGEVNTYHISILDEVTSKPKWDRMVNMD